LINLRQRLKHDELHTFSGVVEILTRKKIQNFVRVMMGVVEQVAEALRPDLESLLERFF
jgi:hypothetical protein